MTLITKFDRILIRTYTVPAIVIFSHLSIMAEALRLIVLYNSTYCFVDKVTAVQGHLALAVLCHRSYTSQIVISKTIHYC